MGQEICEYDQSQSEISTCVGGRKFGAGIKVHTPTLTASYGSGGDGGDI